MATRYDFVIDQGSDTSIPISFKDAEGAPVNYTGYGARMQLRKSPICCTASDELSTANGRIEVEDNTVTIVFPHAVTEQMSATRYAYDLELVSPSDEVTRVLEGFVTLRQEVTR